MTVMLTNVRNGFSSFIAPRDSRFDVRDQASLKATLKNSHKLDCLRNFFSVHVCTTLTLAAILVEEFFRSSIFIVKEAIFAFRDLLNNHKIDTLNHVKEALLDLIHMIKVVLFGTPMIIASFFFPKKIIPLFEKRFDQMQAVQDRQQVPADSFASWRVKAQITELD